MKVWVTGIAGFLGSHIAEMVAAHAYTVGGNDNLICGDENNLDSIIIDRESSIFDISLDCRDYDGMKTRLEQFKPDVLVHCAATAHEGLSSFSPSFITKNIYEASVATFSAAIAAGVKRIVFMSSMSRYGAGDPLPPPFMEDVHIPSPVDPYAVAKVAAEKTLKILCNTHGVSWSIAVPHNIIGIRQRSVDPFRNVASIMINRCKLEKPPVIYGDGSQKRCFSPVADCLPSLFRMICGDADGQVVNIGPDGGEITIKELAYKIMDMTGFSGDPLFFPDRPNEVKEAYCSSEKARKLLGYQPRQSIDDCLKEMVDYIRPGPFVYDFPLEIVTDRTPRTWKERLM